MRVLLVEDDLTLQRGLAQVLAEAGHQAVVAGDGVHADTLLATESFDLVVLDLGLPGMDGIEVLERLRQRRQTIPVLILSARDRTLDRVRGLDRGADDYMTKPFELSEFEARVRALLRRGQGATLKIGRLEWFWDRREVTADEAVLPFSRHEISVLEALLQDTRPRRCQEHPGESSWAKTALPQATIWWRSTSTACVASWPMPASKSVRFVASVIASSRRKETIEMPRQYPSLRSRLTRRLALVLAGIGVIGAIAAYWLGSSYANLAYDRALADDVLTMAEQVSMKQGQIQVALPDAALKWLLADEGDLVLYRVTDLRSMTVLAVKGDLGPIPSDIDVNGQAAYRDVETGGRRMRVSYMRHLVDPNDVPVLVEIGETTGKRDKMTRAILGATILFMATMIAVAVGLVRHGVRTALAPLKLLEAEVAQRSGTELTPLDPLHAPEEVRGLINAINRLMARVSSVVESQSHFIANAAHQLRTPLAGLNSTGTAGEKSQ